VVSPAALLRKLASVSLFSIISISLTGCGGVQTPKQLPPPVASAPQGTFVYVGGMAGDSSSIFPTTDTDALASYQVQTDGTLKKLGAYDRSDLPDGIAESAAAGQWLFTCDARPLCQEFRVDSTGNLVRGADISNVGLHQVTAIDPAGNWLIASSLQGEQVFRIQPDGSLVPGPRTPVPVPQPPASPDILGFLVITFDPTGNFVFARNLLDLSDPPGVFGFNGATGTFTRTSTLPPDLTVPGFRFMGFTSDGRHAMGVQNSTEEIYVFDWDPSTGVLGVHSHGVFTLNDGISLFAGFMAIADNLVFVPQGTESVVLRFDPAAGTISDTGQRFSNDGVENGPMRADTKTRTIMGTDRFGNLIGVWKYDPVTGATRSVPGSPYASGQSPEIVGLFAH
jgi:hypothetical protein